MVNKRFWHGRKILITGYEGFLGSWLTKALLSYNADIIGLDILTGRKETILTRAELKKMKVVTGSVEDYSLLAKLIQNQKIEYIFHLAAQSIVGISNEEPLHTFHTNIAGTWNVLETSRKNNRVKSIIIASSDKAYGIHNKLPYREDYSFLRGSHPYDVSKSCADLIAYTYYNTYRLPVCVTRCGNIYGPGDFHFSRIIPDTIRCAILKKELIIRSDGTFTRDYIYIKDIVDGYLLLAQKMNTGKFLGEAFNFSNERPMSVLGLVKKIESLSGGNKLQIKIIDEAKHEIRHQYLSARKAKDKLGWKPSYNLECGLKETINWYRTLFLKNIRKKLKK